MKIALVPTGQTECRGLHAALKNLFPAHDFVCVPSETELNIDPDLVSDGFTSERLRTRDTRNPPAPAVELIERAVRAALYGQEMSDQAVADIVIIIDDLELKNQHQPDRVVEVMRRSVNVHLHNLLEEFGPGQIVEDTRNALRNKVSFHLAVPMIEAWFFADNNALVAAGVTPGKPMHFASTTDPEAFETGDQAYLDAELADCYELAALDPAKQGRHRPKWLGEHLRRHHPKGYLQWLCYAPDKFSCTSYDETEGGVAALRGLDWQAISDRHPTQFAYLRALIEDLSHGLRCQPAIPLGPPHGPPPTALDAPRPDGIAPLLRNL